MREINGVTTYYANGETYPAVNIKVRAIRRDFDALLPIELGQVKDVGETEFKAVFTDPEFTMEWVDENIRDGADGWWDLTCQDGFQQAVELAKETFGDHVEVYQEGRSGGWLVVGKLDDVEEWTDEQVARWVEFAGKVNALVEDVPRAYLVNVYTNVYEAEQNKVQSASPLPVHKFLDLSTGHLTQYELDNITAAPGVARPHEYGAFVHVQRDDVEEFDAEMESDGNFPNLLAAIRLARTVDDCWWINFDRDADGIDQLGHNNDEGDTLLVPAAERWKRDDHRRWLVWDSIEKRPADSLMHDNEDAAKAHIKTLLEEPDVPSSRYKPLHTDVLPGGDVGGDVQAGEAWSVRYLARDRTEELAAVSHYWYAAQLDANDEPTVNDDKRVRFGVQCQTIFSTYTNAEDPGGSETWSEYEYAVVGGTFETLEEADASAFKCATLDFADDITWDGLSEHWTRD